MQIKNIDFRSQSCDSVVKREKNEIFIAIFGLRGDGLPELKNKKIALRFGENHNLPIKRSRGLLTFKTFKILCYHRYHLA